MMSTAGMAQAASAALENREGLVTRIFVHGGAIVITALPIVGDAGPAPSYYAVQSIDGNGGVNSPSVIGSYEIVQYIAFLIDQLSNIGAKVAQPAPRF